MADNDWREPVLAAATLEMRPKPDRIAALEQLAAEMLASYHQGSDGYRGRVGQVQIERWRKTLADDDGD